MGEREALLGCASALPSDHTPRVSNLSLEVVPGGRFGIRSGRRASALGGPALWDPKRAVHPAVATSHPVSWVFDL